MSRLPLSLIDGLAIKFLMVIYMIDVQEYTNMYLN